MNKVPADYVVTESLRFNIALGKENECIMLSSPHKRKLSLTLLSDGIKEEHIHKISSLVPSTKVCVALFHKDFTSSTVGELGWP